MFKDSAGLEWLKDSELSLSRLPAVQMTSATRPARGVLGCFGARVASEFVADLRQCWPSASTLNWLCSPRVSFFRASCRSWVRKLARAIVGSVGSDVPIAKV